MSPTKIPCQPVALAARGANRSRKLISSGCPQLRLRDTRSLAMLAQWLGVQHLLEDNRGGNSQLQLPSRDWEVSFQRIGRWRALNSAPFPVRCSSKGCSAAKAHERRFSPRRMLTPPKRPLWQQCFYTCLLSKQNAHCRLYGAQIRGANDRRQFTASIFILAYLFRDV